MTYEQRDNSGSLFRNSRKEAANHPDHTGSAMIGGVEYWISAWTKESKEGGGRFFSIAFKPKDAPAGKAKAKGKGSEANDGLPIDDDIPF